MTRSAAARVSSVPPNTEARVSVSGRSVVSVGSGRHSFEAPFAEHQARERAELSLESPLADFVEDPEAVSALRDAIRAVSYPDPAGWISGGKWRPDSRLIDMLNMFPLEHPPAVQAAVDEVNARRGHVRAERTAGSALRGSESR